MPDDTDWIKRMLERGLLTPEQAAQERAKPQVGDASPATPVSLPQPEESQVLISCGPCGTVFPASGIDLNRPPACPSCSGPTRIVSLGGRISTMSPATPLPPPGVPEGGRTFGRYTLRRELGRGGMGVVYEAWDPALGRAVALKTLSTAGLEFDEAAVERLLREARSAAKLRHPGIVAVHEIGRADGRHYFTMELVDGPNLESRFAENNKMFPLRKRLEVLVQIAEALAYAHANGVVHRDVKPSNVLFASDGRAKLADFGLAKEFALPATASGLTLSGIVLGTPRYMSPEQAAGRVRAIGPASDVFSFGVLLYRAASGHMPFGGEGVDALHRTIHEDPPPPVRRGGRLPPGLVAVCMKCLEKDPRNRYPDGTALAEEMKRLLAGEPVLAQEPRKSARAWRGRPTAPSASPTPVTMDTPHARALRFLELGRPSLDRVLAAEYEADVDEAALARRRAEAREKFEEATRLEPGLASAHYLLGLALESEGLIDASERAWREALRLDPEFGPAHYWLGKSQLVHAYVDGMAFGGDLDNVVQQRREEARSAATEALRNFEAAVAKGSGFEDALQVRVAEAMSAFARDDRESARRICNEGLLEFPRSQGREEFHWLLSLVSEGDTAMEDVTRAIQIRPRFALAYFSRSRIWRDRGNWEQVRADLARVVDCWPGFWPGWVSISRAYSALDRIDESQSAAEHAILLSPHCGGAWTNRGHVRYRRGDLVGALEDFTRAIEVQPFNALSINNRAQINTKLGRYREAIEDFRTALRLRPDDVFARNDMGVAYLLLGESAEAEAIYDELLRIAPNHATAWNNRGSARLDLKKCRDAISDCTEALRIKPDYPSALHNRALGRLRTGDPAGAERDASHAIRVQPEYGNAWKRRGQARLALERFGEARDDLRECVRLSPADAEAWLALGDALAAEGDKDGARDAWHKARDSATPGSAERTDAEKRLS